MTIRTGQSKAWMVILLSSHRRIARIETSKLRVMGRIVCSIARLRPGFKSSSENPGITSSISLAGHLSKQQYMYKNIGRDGDDYCLLYMLPITRHLLPTRNG